MFANLLVGWAQDVESVEADGAQDDPAVSTIQKEILKRKYIQNKKSKPLSCEDRQHHHLERLYGARKVVPGAMPIGHDIPTTTVFGIRSHHYGDDDMMSTFRMICVD